MDALSDPYTVFFATAGEGGTPIGLVACMVVWCLIGAVVGRYLHSLNTPRDVVTVLSDAMTPSSAPATQPAPAGRRERAKALEEELRRKQKKEEVVQQEAAKDLPNAEGGSEDWSDEEDEESVDSETEALEELRLKMVLIVRKDEPALSAPSIATKASHAALAVLHNTLTAYQNSGEGDKAAGEVAEKWWQWYLWWNQIGVAKITLKCPDRQTLLDLHVKAVDCRLPCALVDGDILAVGPAPSKDLDVISGTLKLLN